MTRERHRLDRAALWLSFGLYLAACALPATKDWGTTDLGRGGNDHYVTRIGLACLAFGWIFVPDAFEQGSSMMAWLANPIALVGAVLLLFRRPTGAAAFGALSLVVGSLYVIAPPGRTGGHPDLPQIGAWLWLGSLLALTAAALIRRGSSQAQKHAKPTATGDGLPLSGMATPSSVTRGIP